MRSRHRGSRLFQQQRVGRPVAAPAALEADRMDALQRQGQAVLAGGIGGIL